MKETLTFEYFFKQLNAGESIDETCFYFIDDENKEEHYLGFLPKFEKPYWVGCCDIPDGTEYHTAEELVNDPIFLGRSLKERWAQVRIWSIEGCNLDDWLTLFSHV